MLGLIAVAAVAAGCGESGDEVSQPAAQVSVNPGDGAQAVNPRAPISAEVQHGRLDHVTLTGSDGSVIPGKLSPDQSTWRPSQQLHYDVRYTWAGKALNSEGELAPVGGQFHTLAPESTIGATISPTDGQEVGVGMPISIRFDEAVQDKAAVERALEVQPSRPVEGSWAWLTDEKVHWRPKEYWPAHTHVQVEANLRGVAFGGGAFGEDNTGVEFDVGRQQIVKADVQSHQIVVERDGEPVATYPAAFGAEFDPGRRTMNGTYIVMARVRVQYMTNPEYGYFNEPYPWAVRFSNHGEFIHGHDGNAAAIGNTNNSHGCVNLTSGNAQEYYQSAMIGDPVEVTGSASDMPPGYDVYDWLIPWEEWQAKSALHKQS
ncbi:L,D-transpeptidase [Salinifilum ghardaiensis]